MPESENPSLRLSSARSRFWIVLLVVTVIVSVFAFQFIDKVLEQYEMIVRNHGNGYIYYSRFPYFLAVTVLSVICSVIIARQWTNLAGLEDISTRQAERAAERVAAEPEKAQPAWELARTTLQLYFNRNLSQINSIFWLAAAVMAAGFGLITYGVWLAISQKDSPAGPIIAGVAGVISQFIGATFLFIYKSTLQQADKFVRQLERMNTVGMAMQILDTMNTEANESNLKDKTKAKLIDLFVRHAHSTAEGSAEGASAGDISKSAATTS